MYQNQLTTGVVNPKKRPLDLPAFNNPYEPIIIEENEDASQATPKLKKARQTPSDLTLEENSAVPTSGIKLTIELVPETCWFDNVRTNIPASRWNKLSKEQRERANCHCEICNKNGDVKNLDCHEIWHYDQGKII